MASPQLVQNNTNLSDLYLSRFFKPLLDTGLKIKLIRHLDNRYDLNKVYFDGNLDEYQKRQKNDVFNCDIIVSFLGLSNRRAMYIGSYRVIEKSLNPKPLSQDLVSLYGADLGEGANFEYKLQELDALNEYKQRLIIDWGEGALMWHQHFPKNDKEVVEIRPKGFFKQFSEFEDIMLSHSEMKYLIENRDSNLDWFHHLSSVSGVYLILDHDGKQYVGAAYGKNGIWGRWENYARNTHGENKLLKEALLKDPNCYKKWQWSILKVLPKKFSEAEALEYENLYKKKLGSRVIGLNSN